MGHSTHPGQKPVDVRALEAGGKPYGRRLIWLTFRELAVERPVDLITLAIKTRIHKRTVQEYLNALVKAGYAEKSYLDKRVAYRLIRDVGVDHPRVNKDGKEITTSRDNMWRTMKILGRFGTGELAATASTEQCKVSPVDAEDYCKHLRRAGYLREAAPATNTSKAVYLLVPAMRTGPLAPMVQRTKVVFDPNLNQVVWHEELEP